MNDDILADSNTPEDVPLVDTSGKVDVQSLTVDADVPPEDAARFINNSKEWGVTPSGYNLLAKHFDKETERSKYPTHVPAPIADEMSVSREHASVIKPDLGIFAGAFSQTNYALDAIKGRGFSRTVYDLTGRKIWGGTLTDDQEIELLNAQDKQTEHNKTMQQYKDFTFAETVPGEVVSGVVDFGRSVWESKDLIAEGAAITGLYSGVTGLMGGPAAAVGAGAAGALTGASWGLGAGLTRDALFQSTGGTYDEIVSAKENAMLDPKTMGTPIANISEAEIEKLSKGAGLLMAGLSLIPTTVIAKQVPWLKAIVSPKSLVTRMLQPGGNKWRNLLLALGKSALAEGGEEALQETVQVIAAAMANSGSENKFMDGIKTAVAQREQNVPRIAKAGVMGGLVGATVTGAGHAVSPIINPILKIKTDDGKPAAPPPIVHTDTTLDTSVPPEVTGTRAVQLSLIIRQHSEMTKDTQTNKHLPDSVDNIRQKMWENAGVSQVWVDKDELTAWADTEKKAAAARKILDPSGTAASEINGPIRIEMKNFLRLVDQHPEVSDLAKADPATPSAVRWKLKLSEAELQRRGIVESVTPTQTTETQPLEVKPRGTEVNTADDYISQDITFTEAQGEVLPKTEILKYNRDQILARQEVSEAIKIDQEKKMDKVVALDVMQNLVAEEEFQRYELENDRHVNIVEDFLDNSREIGELNRFQEQQKAEGKPIYAIDPKTLSADETKQFATNKKLYDRGVFDPQGMPIIDAMVIFGAKSPRELLQILSTTPTKEESIDAAVKFNEAAIIEESKSANKEFEKSETVKAYNNKTRNHIAEMKILRDKYWTSLKAGIKRIALPLPRIEQLITKAKDAVGKTAIKFLNVNEWAVAERNSQKIAVKAVLENDTEVAWREKENAALATQMAKETRVAIGRVNKAFQWIANLGSERVQNELKEAGTLYQDAINRILDVYNFDPKQKGQSKVDGYNKYIAKMVETGQADFEIPPEVQEWLTPKASAAELTVDQLLAITDHMRRVVYQARLKNKLMKTHGVETTVDIIAEDLKELAESHPLYDPNKAVEAQGDISAMEKASIIARGAEAFIQNIKSITTRLGQGILHNKWEQLIWQAIEGSGAYKGPYGLLALDRIQSVIRKKIQAAIKVYGTSEWRNLGITKVLVPEFANNRLLNNGKLTKLDLFRILQHMGTDSNKKRVENFNVDRETMMKVLERELTKKDFDFVQNTIWGTFDSLKERIAANHLHLTGEELVFLEPESFEAHGKTYQGGYSPIKLKRDTSMTAIEYLNSLHEKLAGAGAKVDVPYSPSLEGLVRSPHTKDRTDHNYVIDLNTDSFSVGIDEALYGLTMGVPVRDVMTLLTNKSIATSIKSIVGVIQYNTLVNHVAGLTLTAKSTSELQFGKHMQAASQIFNVLGGRFVVNLLAASPTTFAANFLSVLEVQRKMGMVNGTKHMGLAAARFINPRSWGKWNEMIKFAAEIDPTLFRWKEGLDDYNISSFADIMPKKYIIKNKPYRLLVTGQEKMNHVLMSGLFGLQDAVLKTITIHAAYNQYLAGEAPGHPLAEIEKMSQADRHRNASAYAGSLAAETTMRAKPSDKAAIQKIPFIKEFARLFNETRNVLNNTIQDFHNIGYDAEAGTKAWKDGDFESANAKFHGANSRLATMLIITLVTKALMTALQGKNVFAIKAEDEEEPTQLKDIPEWLAYSLTSGLPSLVGKTMLGANTPMLRDFLWSVETGKGLSFPALGALDHVAKTAGLIPRYLQDELNFLEFYESLEEKDFKAVWNTIGLATGGLPVNAYYKYMKLIDDGNDGYSIPGGDVVLGGLAATIGHFSNKYGPNKNDKAFEELLNSEKSKSDKAFEDLMSKEPQSKADDSLFRTELEKVAEQSVEIGAALGLNQAGHISKEIPENYYAMVKQAESRGKWNAGDPDGAFGIYQFIESTWKRVINTKEGKEARLTMAGRLGRKNWQQEKGMQILTEGNARILKKVGVPLTTETLYFTHHFGVDNADEVYGTKDRKAVKKLPKALRAPRILSANPQLKGIKTTEQMRAYILKVVKRGEQGIGLAENTKTKLRKQKPLNVNTVGR